MLFLKGRGLEQGKRIYKHVMADLVLARKKQHLVTFLDDFSGLGVKD